MNFISKLSLSSLAAAIYLSGPAVAQSFRADETEVEKIIKGLECGGAFECSEAPGALRTRGFRKKRNFKFVPRTEEGRKEIEERADMGELPSIDRHIFFAFNSDDLTASAQQMLTNVGTALTRSQLRPYTFLLIGHTDAKGSSSYNQNLSERRARAARDFLISTFNISPDRLIPEGRGEDRLKLPHAPLSAQNRRVEFINAGAN